MAGTLTISTLSDGTNSTSSTNCIQGSAKAWVNFEGSTGTRRGSFNISSITRASAGQYTINLTNAMPNINYSAIASVSTTSTPVGCFLEMFTATNSTQVATAPTTTSFSMAVLQYNGAAFLDPVYVNVAVFSS